MHVISAASSYLWPYIGRLPRTAAAVTHSTPEPEPTLTLPHRMLDRALSVVPVTTKLSDPRELLKFQVKAWVILNFSISHQIYQPDKTFLRDSERVGSGKLPQRKQ